MIQRHRLGALLYIESMAALTSYKLMKVLDSVTAKPIERIDP